MVVQKTFLTILFVILVAASFYAFALIDETKPWHPLQQISRSINNFNSLDNDKNGRIDPGIIEDTLQDITNNGAETTNALTMGGLTVTGISSFTGQATFNNNILVKSNAEIQGNIILNNNALKNCKNDLITDANGKIICSSQEDKDPNNELQNLAQVLNKGNDAQGQNIVNVGKLGIGTSTPQEAVDVNGNIKWGSRRGLLKTDQGASIELGGIGTPYIDFSNDASSDYDMRLILRGDNELRVEGGNLRVMGNTYTNALCLSDGCKTSWSQVGGNSFNIFNIDNDKDGVPLLTYSSQTNYVQADYGVILWLDCDDNNPDITTPPKYVSGHCDADGDKKINVFAVFKKYGKLQCSAISNKFPNLDWVDVGSLNSNILYTKSDAEIYDAADGSCDGDGDGYIDKTAYKTVTFLQTRYAKGPLSLYCDYDDNHEGGWSGYGCSSCPWGYVYHWYAYYCKLPNGARGPMCRDSTGGKQYWDILPGGPLCK